MGLDLLPWDIREEHRDTHLHRMLERESLRRAGLPCGTQEDLDELEDWRSTMARHGAVVDYLPQRKDGFILVYARPGGDEDLIRRPGDS